MYFLQCANYQSNSADPRLALSADRGSRHRVVYIDLCVRISSRMNEAASVAFNSGLYMLLKRVVGKSFRVVDKPDQLVHYYRGVHTLMA